MFTNAFDLDFTNNRWSQDEENKLKTLILLAPAINDPKASNKSKQEAWEGVAKMMKSRTVQQCKSKFYKLKEINFPSSTISSASLSTSKISMKFTHYSDNHIKSTRWSKAEEDKLKTLVLLHPVVKDTKTSQKSKQEVWEGIAKMMQSKTVEQCKKKFYSIQQCGFFAKTNFPSSTVASSSSSSSTSTNESTLLMRNRSGIVSGRVSKKQRSTSTLFEHNLKGNKVRRNIRTETSIQHFFQSISSDIKKLSQDKQRIFKQKVMEVIVELCEDDD
ncbi:hypothetical protein ILUMI_09414 [Ignelater luminosus]|uniref:Myb-like domain-containing protein n=1 Tax=Ignelater luminosus TaxID=2038154 RepID=A0A8K0G9P0_IGNLU|nr:hypothetical protein ILUMI_09414 [Ignelater luminosus]